MSQAIFIPLVTCALAAEAARPPVRCIENSPERRGQEGCTLFWLDRAIERGMINYPFLSKHDQYLDNVRGDARFGQLMERARREWERFEV